MWTTVSLWKPLAVAGHCRVADTRETARRHVPVAVGGRSSTGGAGTEAVLMDRLRMRMVPRALSGFSV